MNSSISLNRRDEKLGAAALIVATLAVLIWGQLAPQGIIGNLNAAPRATVESESAEARPVTLKVDSPRLQTRAMTSSLPSA
jgi:hypothetical protein